MSLVALPRRLNEAWPRLTASGPTELIPRESQEQHGNAQQHTNIQHVAIKHIALAALSGSPANEYVYMRGFVCLGLSKQIKFIFPVRYIYILSDSKSLLFSNKIMGVLPLNICIWFTKEVELHRNWSNELYSPFDHFSPRFHLNTISTYRRESTS